MSGDPPSVGFAPVANPGIKTLILGSLPSRRSIAAGQYYGHPQNAFWKIMGELIDAGPDKPYTERCERLLAAEIGLWDVLESSFRPGSMDADIELSTTKPNDFGTFLHEHAAISRICFNGRKAADLFRRLVRLPRPDAGSRIELLGLPSTSPAYASMPFADKLRRWSIVTEPMERVR